MITLLLGVGFIMGTLSLGAMLSRLVGITSSGHTAIRLGWYFIAGSSIISLITYVLWVLQRLDQLPLILTVLFVISALAFVLQEGLKTIISTIAVFVTTLLVTVYAAGNNFDLLWDAKASWLLKAKSFFEFNQFPGDLFTNPITTNIAKDYPPWTSLLYGALARFSGEWSEVNIKVLQSLIVVLVVASSFAILRVLIAKIKGITSTTANLVTVIVTMATFGNYYFFLYMQSGYIDYTVLLYWVVMIGGIILFLNEKDNDWLTIAGVVGYTALLVKNEGMALFVFFVLFVGLKYGKKVFNNFPLKSLLWVVPSLLAFASWQIFKNRYGFVSPLVPKGNLLSSIVSYIGREIIVVILYLWEWARNLNKWFLSYTMGVIGLLVVGYRSIQALRSRLLDDAARLSLCLLIAIGLYFVPYGVADLGIGFFFESTRDRIALQLIPPIVILATYILTRDYTIVDHKSKL